MEDENVNKTKKKFWKDDKNIAIVILSVMLISLAFLSPTTYSTLDAVGTIDRLSTEINELKQSNDNLQKELEDNKNAITKLTEEKQALENEKNQLAEEKQKLSDEKQKLEEDNKQLNDEKTQLNNQIEQLKKTSSTQTTEQKKTSQVSSNTQKTTSTTVYVTNTGNKYHRSGCSYLRKSSNAISKDAAISQGYTPCSRCNP